MRVWHGCRRIGQDPLPWRGSAIIIANHPNHADPGFLMASSGRRLSFLQAREEFNSLWKPILRWAGCIPVSRDGHDIVALRQALNHLRAGGVLVVFPASHVITELPGGTCIPRRGAAYLALRARTPVFPARITGVRPAGTVLGDWLWPSQRVRVQFGLAVNLSEFYDQPMTRKLVDDVMQLLVRRMEELK
jgi:1-acyl-sn-glycerol-3-phosphate acyltransferase